MSDEMRCQAMRPLLTQEELSDREREELESHLAECEGCRRSRDEHRAVWSLLGAASVPSGGPSDSEFLAGVRERCSSAFPKGRWRSIFRSPAGRWVAAAAAAVLAATGFLWFRSGSEDQAIIENLTVLEDLQAVQAGNGTEFAEVGRELLSLLEEEAEAVDPEEWLELPEGSLPTKKG